MGNAHAITIFPARQHRPRGLDRCHCERLGAASSEARPARSRVCHDVSFPTSAAAANRDQLRDVLEVGSSRAKPVPVRHGRG